MEFVNSYEDASRADAYSTLQFANTYFLAYRDLPAIIANHVAGKRALDFGCVLADRPDLSERLVST